MAPATSSFRWWEDILEEAYDNFDETFEKVLDNVKHLLEKDNGDLNPNFDWNTNLI